ncbi:sigma-54-dependent Fis family transcriptional regulator [Azotobacter vinelandii]|uniref:sigma-54-dependent Fis family transcriptional regulator n=1 Tax=Azotobacter vinelandii TaxID=354 RepID=UPI00077385B7|nr:sigma-54-dependent Fis family transcriptional regulator [Azotobacter vinelandii]
MSSLIPKGVFSCPEDNQRIKAAWQHFLQSAELPGDVAVRPPIDQSWRRCLDSRVDPGLRQAPEPLTEAQLQAIRERHRRLLDASMPVMAMARELMAQSGNIMLLADRNGMVIEAGGDYATLSQAERIHLMPGSPWNEQFCGTNAIGTALLLGQPVQIHAAEHFCEGIKRWTCSASVIRDPRDGHILGALDVSGESQSFSRHSLALAVTTAHRIESALARHEMASRYRLLELSIEQLAAHHDEGLLLFDPHGFLVRSNLHGPAALAARGIDLDIRGACRLPALALGPEGSPAGPLPDWLPGDWLRPVQARGEVLGMLVRIPWPARAAGTLVAPKADQRAPAERAPGFARLVGNSAAMVAALHKAQQLAGCNVPVLLQGETGAGKEAFAQGIHYSGIGREGPFVAINCGSLSRELLASELFGYAEGAFTGARRGGMKGKIEAAHGGTLFLDEIGEMPLDLQSHLLRALEEGEIYRLGECEPRRVDFRLVTATHRDLREEVAQRRFRQDLFYRVAVTSIRIPPLRERRDDIPLLAGHILKREAERHGRPLPELDPEALQALMAHDWPGNVRELRNVLEGMLLLGGRRLTRDDLPDELRQSARLAAGAVEGQLEEAEREVIRQAIERSRGNLTQAAKALGIAKSTLYLRLRKYGMSRVPEAGERLRLE